MNEPCRCHPAHIGPQAAFDEAAAALRERNRPSATVDDRVERSEAWRRLGDSLVAAYRDNVL